MVGELGASWFERPYRTKRAQLYNFFKNPDGHGVLGH